MSWTQSFINLLDAFGAPTKFLSYGDGTNNAFAHNVLDLNGNAISPAVATGAVHLTAAPTVTAGAYTTGMVVGQGGVLALAGAARTSGGSGLIQSVAVTVKTALTAPYDVLFFDTNPTNSTFTDNAALNLNVADLPFLVPAARCADTYSLGTPQLIQATNLAIPFKLSTGTTLYAAIVIRGAQTFASTSALGLSVQVLPD